VRKALTQAQYDLDLRFQVYIIRHTNDHCLLYKAKRGTTSRDIYKMVYTTLPTLSKLLDLLLDFRAKVKIQGQL
jgi:hypothetical protein